jgi:hypothetical protein
VARLACPARWAPTSPFSSGIDQKGAKMMELKVLSRHIDGEIQFHVVDADSAGGEPAVIFTASSWAEAEQYIADLGGG